MIRNNIFMKNYLMKTRSALGALSFLICSPSLAGTIDVAELESLLKQREFQQIAQILVTRPADDTEVLAWLRSHKDDWNPPLMSDLSFRLIAQIKKTPNKELANELSVTYSRAKTGYFVDRADCKTKTRQTQNHSETIGILDTIIMNGFRPPKTVVLSWAQDAIEWSKKMHAKNQMAAATWLCGADNLLPEIERSANRLKNQDEMQAQIKSLLENPAIGN